MFCDGSPTGSFQPVKACDQRPFGLRLMTDREHWPGSEPFWRSAAQRAPINDRWPMRWRPD